jgi:hypothetical protein
MIRSVHAALAALAATAILSGCTADEGTVQADFAGIWLSRDGVPGVELIR